MHHPQYPNSGNSLRQSLLDFQLGPREACSTASAALHAVVAFLKHQIASTRESAIHEMTLGVLLQIIYIDTM